VSPALAPLVVVLVVLMIDAWVYQDAKRWAEHGTPVVFRAANFVVDTPLKWFAWCVVLWIVFFPAYLVSRS
jgi:hypothetical protein